MVKQAASDLVEILNIPGLGKVQRITVKYDYEGAKSDCPSCGGAGWPWAGWFTCDECLLVAVVDTGECFMRIPQQ